MLDLLAQATYSYNTSTSSNAGELSSGGLAALMVAYFIIVIPILIFFVICLWKIFVKAGVEGWKALIPGYNMWIQAELAGKPGWWGIVGLGGVIPVLGFVFSIAAFVLQILINIDFAKAFGKSSNFAILLILLPIVGLPMLAFGDAKYIGPGGVSKGAKPVATPPTPTATA